MSRGAGRWWLLALLLVGALARLPGLGQEPFWTDEMHTVRVAGIPHDPGQPAWHVGDLLEVTQGPLFMLLAHGWAALVGRSEAALRLLPVLFGLLALPLAWSLATRLIGARAGWFTAILLALSPFHVWYSRELRGYTMVILAALAATAVLESALSGPRRPVPAWLAYAGTALAGLGASFTMAFVLAAHALVVIVRRARSGWIVWCSLAAALALLMIIAWPWIDVIQDRFDLGRLVGRGQLVEAPLRGPTTFPPAAIPYTFFAFAGGFSLGPSLEALHTRTPAALLSSHWPWFVLVAVLFGGSALLGIAALWRRRRSVTLALLAWLLVPFALATLLAAANVKTWNPRYVAVTLPVFLMFVAAGADRWRGRRAWVVLALPLLVELVALVNLHTDATYWKEDSRAAGVYLEERLVPGDAMIGEGATRPLFYYMSARPDRFTLLRPHRLDDPAELARRVQVASAGAPRVWLYRSRTWLCDPTNRVGALLADGRRRVARQTFRGVEIECFE